MVRFQTEGILRFKVNNSDSNTSEVESVHIPKKEATKKGSPRESFSQKTSLQKKGKTKKRNTRVNRSLKGALR